MTPTDIPEYWDQVKHLFDHRWQGFMILLRIAKSGNDFVHSDELRRISNDYAGKLQLTRWVKVGILERAIAPSRGKRGGRPRNMYRLTDKGFRLFRLSRPSIVSLQNEKQQLQKEAA